MVFCKAQGRWYTVSIMMTENNMGAESYQTVWESIKNRFMIVLILSILVSSALASLYNVQKTTSDMAYLAILTPVFLILSLVVTEIFKNRFNGFFLNIINKVLLVAIASYVFPLMFVAFFKTVATIGMVMKAILFIAVWGVPAVALVLLLCVVVAGFVTRN